MKKTKPKESVTCGKCNAEVVSPENINARNTCGCKNKAWIMKLPTDNCWAYGAVDFNSITRNKHERKQKV